MRLKKNRLLYIIKRKKKQHAMRIVILSIIIVKLLFTYCFNTFGLFGIACYLTLEDRTRSKFASIAHPKYFLQKVLLFFQYVYLFHICVYLFI